MCEYLVFLYELVHVLRYNPVNCLCSALHKVFCWSLLSALLTLLERIKAK